MQGISRAGAVPVTINFTPVLLAIWASCRIPCRQVPPCFANPGSTFWRSVLPAGIPQRTDVTAGARPCEARPSTQSYRHRTGDVRIDWACPIMMPPSRLAVAIEVGRVRHGCCGGPRECRRRHLLTREASLAITQEDQRPRRRGEYEMEIRRSNRPGRECVAHALRGTQRIQKVRQFVRGRSVWSGDDHSPLPVSAADPPCP